MVSSLSAYPSIAHSMSGTDIVHVVNRLKSHLVVAKFIDPRHAHRGHVLIDFKRAGWDGWVSFRVESGRLLCSRDW